MKELAHVGIAFSALVVLFGGGCSDSTPATQPPTPNGNLSVPSIPLTPREQYAARQSKILTIVEPLSAIETFYWKDGGSIGLALTDFTGVKHKFAWDGRANKPRNIFIGVDYPPDSNGRMVSPGGAEEGELYGVLMRWINQHSKREAFYDAKLDVNTPTEPWLWELRTFFLRLDKRFNPD